MKLLGVIPARGGSVGIPRKNLRLLNGQPLIAYAIASAHNAHSLSRVIVSTDDDEIAEVANHLGADVPFMRPAQFAQSESPTIDVMRHALDMLRDENYDAVVTIQPTAPLRIAADIDAAVGMLTDAFDSVVSVAEVPHQFNPHWVYRLENEDLSPFVPDGPLRYTRRQNLPPAYYRNGAVYVTRSQVINTFGNLYGAQVAAYVMPPERSVNIDSPIDLMLAEFYLRMSAG